MKLCLNQSQPAKIDVTFATQSVGSKKYGAATLPLANLTTIAKKRGITFDDKGEMNNG